MDGCRHVGFGVGTAKQQVFMIEEIGVHDIHHGTLHRVVVNNDSPGASGLSASASWDAFSFFSRSSA